MDKREKNYHKHIILYNYPKQEKASNNEIKVTFLKWIYWKKSLLAVCLQDSVRLNISITPSKYSKASVIWIRNVPHSFAYKNILTPVGGAVGEGSGIFRWYSLDGRSVSLGGGGLSFGGL